MGKVAFVALLAAVVVLSGCGKSRREQEAESQRLEQQQREANAKQVHAEEERRQAAQRASQEALAELHRRADAELVARFEKYVADTLKDPQSAQFADVHLNVAKDALCGRVNAKNAFGGYVGFVKFVATESGPVRGVNAYLENSDNLLGALYPEAAKRTGCID